jgi:hypothetical protein
MTGKLYYMTTLGDLHRHSARLTGSHWLALGSQGADPPTSALDEKVANATPILALIEADEGAHLALEDDPTFEALPHPFAPRPLSESVQAALAPHGIVPGATAFDAAETLARIHPLLRPRVF